MKKPTPYKSLSKKNPDELISLVREGVSFYGFTELASFIPFDMQEWSKYLHLSERTLLRYKKEKKNFDPIYAERILQISMLYQRGLAVFVEEEHFHKWLDTRNIALGSVRPKDLFDSYFGLNLVNDELTRIEHGVFA